MRLDYFLHVVNDIRKRLNPRSIPSVILGKSLYHGFKRILRSLGDKLQLPASENRKFQACLVITRSDICHIHAVITYPLKVSDGIKDLKDNHLIIVCESPSVDLYNIIRKRRFTPVYEIFILLHCLKCFRIKLIYKPCSKAEILDDLVRHDVYDPGALLQGYAGSPEDHGIKPLQLPVNRYCFLIL